jgi:hypothetical protein
VRIVSLPGTTTFQCNPPPEGGKNYQPSRSQSRWIIDHLSLLAPGLS